MNGKSHNISLNVIIKEFLTLKCRIESLTSENYLKKYGKFEN